MKKIFYLFASVIFCSAPIPAAAGESAYAAAAAEVSSDGVTGGSCYIAPAPAGLPFLDRGYISQGGWPICAVAADLNAKLRVGLLPRESAWSSLRFMIRCLEESGHYRLNSAGTAYEPAPIGTFDQMLGIARCNDLTIEEYGVIEEEPAEIEPAPGGDGPSAAGGGGPSRVVVNLLFWQQGGCRWLQRLLERDGAAVLLLSYEGHAQTLIDIQCPVSPGDLAYLTVNDPNLPSVDIVMVVNSAGTVIGTSLGGTPFANSVVVGGMAIRP